MACTHSTLPTQRALQQAPAERDRLSEGCHTFLGSGSESHKQWTLLMIKTLVERAFQIRKSCRDAVFRALRSRDGKDFHMASPEGRVFL